MTETEQEPAYVPARVRELAGAGPVELVWRNEAGGLTFRAGERYLKWAPTGSGRDLGAEAVRLRWAGRFAVVPPVLAQGADQDGSWLVTAALPGTMAVDDRWKREPATAVRAIGEGLRALHEALPVADCPFEWSAQQRLAVAAELRADPAEWHAEHRHLGTVERALELLAEVPPVDRAVVCHGDPCAPNTLLGPDGRWSGHVDLGALGVADRWADLAVATWSTGWNYGPGWERALLDAYGVDPDPDRSAYYRLLWDVS
ncbi:aminoglycoside phosphotransferase APH(3') [Streptomyces tateyamensis]|uniref:Aminoglycoside phosphotransferase APH(3') n=1 Tax=Streptomyces tateyamensis TaxID=565073 RepID=A0A2V4NRL8_9ACTN|nr:aminoglycoside 3'-phosphotransferase [Streptomyces tateyamensis]PYC83738.1 aminoglycoside phosphotransferase APH(3') [Streptomyces tateyamensis]